MSRGEWDYSPELKKSTDRGSSKETPSAPVVKSSGQEERKAPKMAPMLTKTTKTKPTASAARRAAAKKRRGAASRRTLAAAKKPTGLETDSGSRTGSIEEKPETEDSPRTGQIEEKQREGMKVEARPLRRKSRLRRAIGGVGKVIGRAARAVAGKTTSKRVTK